MKKFITAVLMLSVVFFSCNQAVKGEYATVVLDLDGSSSGGRAIGQNGLPYLHNTHITIEANGRIGGTFVKEFAPGEAGNIALRLIIGDTVRLRVKASNESGIWSGSTTFTVEDGTNAVSVKLNKTISGAQALTFSMTKSFDASGTPSARLDVYTGNKKICSETATDVSAPSFCRDAKGRIFVAYYYRNVNDVLDLVRYDSEGNNPTTLINGQQSGGVWHLASDLVTGKVYALRYDKTLYEVGEAPLSPLSPSNWRRAVINGFTEVHSIAAHGGQLFVLGKIGTAEKLYVYDNIDSPLSTATPIPSIPLAAGKENSIDPPSGINKYEYTDMFVTDGAVYLLRSDYAAVPDQYGNVYSKGALIKYEYDKDDREIDDKEEFGVSDSGTQNGIVFTPDTSFYGPLKFIGFDDDVLYIADDGVKFTYFNEAPRITANKNRIASFNTSTKSLSFTDTSVTWAKEEKVWKVPQKTLLWKARTEENNTTVFDYYAVDEANSPLGVRPDIKSESKDKYYTDVFCFDQDGALYVLKKDFSDYKVVRYEPTADGGYDFFHHTEAVLPELSNSWISIAVDASGTIETDPPDGNKYNALYYYCIDALNRKKIKRISWKTTDGFSAADTNGYNGIQVDFLVSVTALAANKDGFFAAIKEESGNTYTLKVQKYEHDGTPKGVIEVGSGKREEEFGSERIFYNEQINAMRITDGVLYGISTKEKRSNNGNFFNMSGKLLKLGETDDFNGSPQVLYDGNASSNGDFAPYRFIAVKPKQLVIASDGGYGQDGTTTPQNKNRALIFTLDGSGNTGAPASFDAASAVTFSKELKYAPPPYGSGFVWQ